MERNGRKEERGASETEGEAWLPTKSKSKRKNGVMRKRGIYGRDIVDASVVFRVPSNLFRFFVFFSSFLSSLGDLGNRLSFPRFFLSAPLLRILSKRACYVLEI